MTRKSKEKRSEEQGPAGATMWVMFRACEGVADEKKKKNMVKKYLKELLPGHSNAAAFEVLSGLFYCQEQSDTLGLATSYQAVLDMLVLEDKFIEMVSLWEELGFLATVIAGGGAHRPTLLYRVALQLYLLVRTYHSEVIRKELCRRLWPVISVEFLIELATIDVPGQIYLVHSVASAIFIHNPTRLALFYERFFEGAFIKRYLHGGVEPEPLEVRQLLFNLNEVMSRFDNVPNSERALESIHHIRGEACLKLLSVEVMEATSLRERKECCVGLWMSLEPRLCIGELRGGYHCGGETKKRLFTYYTQIARQVASFISKKVSERTEAEVQACACDCLFSSSMETLRLLGYMHEVYSTVPTESGVPVQATAWLSTATLERLMFPISISKLADYLNQCEDVVMMECICFGFSQALRRRDLGKLERERILGLSNTSWSKWQDLSFGVRRTISESDMEKLSLEETDITERYLGLFETMQKGLLPVPDEDPNSKYDPKETCCAWCGKISEDVSNLCLGCHRVSYCDRGCQSKDWKRNHKTECARTKASDTTS